MKLILKVCSLGFTLNTDAKQPTCRIAYPYNSTVVDYGTVHSGTEEPDQGRDLWGPASTDRCNSNDVVCTSGVEVRATSYAKTLKLYRTEATMILRALALAET